LILDGIGKHKASVPGGPAILAGSLGADFDKSGATKVVSGGFHFVISDHR
jgi:hypothetical protein